MKAYLSEITESIQGEGTLAGSRQIFLRFCGCNLRCPYCDTVGSLSKTPSCKIFLKPGSKNDFREYANPLSISDVVKATANFDTRWVSLTGGEPLLWADYLKRLAPILVSKGHRILLETNGTLVENLVDILEFTAVISMDFKLPSAIGIDLFPVHKRFLELAACRPVYVKVVVTPSTEPWEIGEVARIIAGVDATIPLVLQPVSLVTSQVAVQAEKLFDLQLDALKHLEDVRVIPQIHKCLRVT
ncbi:MAG TPA: 7-carboxy-7-deazaguanine synthase QueE [Syntrophothermus lipocalidus]|nr:7-carboxy-7-deazaguanine synthase QueE [Syntrophothermus lipocalidus]